MAFAPTKLSKYPAEIISYLFDFSKFPEVIAGETLSSPAISVADPSGLTVGSPAVTLVVRDGIAAGKGVQVTISAGSSGETYTVQCDATTSGGSKRSVQGLIEVK